jgi:hypothetical protein
MNIGNEFFTYAYLKLVAFFDGGNRHFGFLVAFLKIYSALLYFYFYWPRYSMATLCILEGGFSFIASFIAIITGTPSLIPCPQWVVNHCETDTALKLAN